MNYLYNKVVAKRGLTVFGLISVLLIQEIFCFCHVACIYAVCLILTITEAYGLRLRHVIMACYFQKRERARAIWLFNHILKTRGGILENARENMKKSKMGQVDTRRISLKGRLAARFILFIYQILHWLI